MVLTSFLSVSKKEIHMCCWFFAKSGLVKDALAYWILPKWYFLKANLIILEFFKEVQSEFQLDKQLALPGSLIKGVTSHLGSILHYCTLVPPVRILQMATECFKKQMASAKYLLNSSDIFSNSYMHIEVWLLSVAFWKIITALKSHMACYNLNLN